MDILRIIGVGLVAAVFAVTVRKNSPETAMQISIAAGIVITLMTIDCLKESVAYIKEFISKYESAYTGLSVVLKIIGIAYICEFTVQILKDAGENSVAAKVEMGGKVTILVLTLPMLAGFAELALSVAGY